MQKGPITPAEVRAYGQTSSVLTIGMPTLDNVLDSALIEIQHAVGWPVDVISLADRMGIQVVHRGGSPRSHRSVGEPVPGAARNRPTGFPSGLEAGFKTDNGGEIHLWFDGDIDRLPARARFSVAHEIAHYIIWRKTDTLPHSLDYWDHEAACDDFAGRLLIPAARLEEFLSVHPGKDPLYLPALLAKQAEVSWHAAAIAISRRTRVGVDFLRLEKRVASKGTEFRVLASTLLGRRGKVIGNKAVIRKGAFCSFLCGLENFGEASEGSLHVEFASVDLIGAHVRGQRWERDVIVTVDSQSV